MKTTEQIFPCEFVVPLPVCEQVKRLSFADAPKELGQAGTLPDTERLDLAIAKAVLRLAKIHERICDRKQADVINAYIIMAQDAELRSDILRQIEDGYTAKDAIENVVINYISFLEKAEQTNLHKRVAEIILDVCKEIIEQLKDIPEPDYSRFKGKIAVAGEVSAVQMILLAEAGVAGVAAACGGHTGHAAIFAKTEGIPYAIKATTLLEKAKDGDMLEFRPEDGLAVLHPVGIQEQHTYPFYIPSKANDFIAANVSGMQSLRSAINNHVSKIGLVRTEALLMKCRKKPDVKEQKLIYQKILRAGIPAYARLTDVDEDKQIPWMNTEIQGKALRGKPAFDENENFYITQIRALLDAGFVRPSGIMLPMMRSVKEFLAIREIICGIADKMGIARESLMVGCMIECPEAAKNSSELAKAADFLSIGTNDLTRYILDVPRSADLTVMHSAVFDIIRKIVRDSHANGITVGVCGDAAANSANIVALMKSAIDYISVPPHLISVLSAAIELYRGI